MDKFGFVVVVPNDKAPVQIVQLPDGDQPCFDNSRVREALAAINATEARTFKYCPISGELLPRGDYRMIAGYDNQLRVEFRTMGHAARFRNLMGIQA